MAGNSARQFKRYDQPVLDYELSNKTVIEGGNVVWRCSAHGKPSKITYHWSKEGMSINTLDLAQRAHIQNGEFGIINVKRTDSGFYECEAGNGENAVKTRAYLNVLYKPELRSRNSDIVVLAEGRKENIECSMDANPTVLQIFWLKNGLPIQPDKSADFQNDTIAETFTIQNASHSDAGLWSCWAQNVVGRSEVYEFHVMIATAPTFSHEPPAETKIDVGSSISVDCAGIGDPPPTQYWLRNMRKITGSRLNILNASYSDHGLYQCVLSNSVVSSVRNFTLFVEKVPPQCSEDINVKCDGESGFNFEFRPGYSSDNEQVFRVLYTPLNDSDTKSLSNNEHVIWQSSEKNSNPFFTIEHLIPFSKYRFLIETSNVFGSVNCSAGEHHVCSVLDSPRNLRVNENKELEWDSVDMANNYRVSYRLSNEKSFNNFSLRSPFVPSKPSEIFTYRTDLTASYNHNYTFFSIFVLLVLIFGVFLTKKRFRTKRSNRDSTSRILPSDNQPPTMFEEDWKALWLTQSEYADSNSDVADDCMFDSIYCSPHVVKSVLQEKYIYSKKNSTLERMREDLHIERLRNEMNQSVL
ncbi:hypothetical protein M3Y96_00831800 [Aphelenchoides besseyi]|nr:hypothetical protein M3Y96_00831800 [Aphelenchoides besseyi]